MKTLQANNLAQAVKELNKIDKSLVEKVNENVKDADKKHYHVILVKVIDRPGQTKNKVTIAVQTYNKPAFEKLKKNYVFQGFAQVILLHDPTQLTAEQLSEPTKTENTDAKATDCDTSAKDQTIKEQASTISEKDQEIADLKAKLAEKDATGETGKEDVKDGADAGAEKTGDSGLPPNDVKGDVDFDVETADFKALNEFAAANEIPLNGARSTDAIREVVKNWLTAKATSK